MRPFEALYKEAEKVAQMAKEALEMTSRISFLELAIAAALFLAVAGTIVTDYHLHGKPPCLAAAPAGADCR